MSNNNSFNLRNKREITANRISMFTDDNLIENTFDMFTRLKKKKQKQNKPLIHNSGKVRHYVEPSDITDNSVPGLKSMIDYFDTNYKLKHNTCIFEDICS